MNGKEVENREIVVEGPWKKIIIVGMIVVGLIFVSEAIGNLQDLLSYFNYGILAFVAIIIFFLIVILLKYNKKAEKHISKNYANNSELKKFLKITDDLLEKLPEEEIKRFSRSEDSKFYESILKKYKIK